MRIRTLFLLSLAPLAGCSGKSTSENVGSVRAQLHRAPNCPALLDDLKTDAIVKINAAIDRQIQALIYTQSRYGDAVAVSGGGVSFGQTSGGAERSASPSLDAGAKASSYSDTNVQVKGVDEADFVKTDGKSIYLLHGQSFVVLNAWPATSLAKISETAIEGAPQEMFVEGGKAVIYSQVNGRRIFESLGLPIREQYTDTWYGGIGMPRAAVDGPNGVGAPAPDPTPTPYVPPVPLTKVTVLSLDGAPTVVREAYFEGSYLSSRRVGSQVRTVLGGGAHGPALRMYPELAAGESWPETVAGTLSLLERTRDKNIAIVRASTLSDWIPNQFVKESGAYRQDRIACEDYYLPTAGTAEFGLTQVHALDLNTPSAPLRGTAIVGNTSTVYGTRDTLYLATRSYRQDPIFVAPVRGTVGVGESSPPSGGSGGSAGGTEVGTRSVRIWDEREVIPLNFTHVHKLEFQSDPSFPNYVASGTVEGQTGDQFSLDEAEGILRISTTEDRLVPQGRSDGRVSHVYTLRADGDTLRKVGDAGEMAPGQSIYSTRFVGNRGYVVTFRQVDPLHVIDLSNPYAPIQLGELEIPGFSTYMHPLDANHLLTIGRDQWRLQLQIFDVSNPRAPRLAHKFLYDGADTYGSSTAEQNHKDFVYFADRKLLAIPMSGYGSSGPTSGLEVFRVDTQTGFDKLGTVNHSEFLPPASQGGPYGYCGGYYTPQVRRGIFMENFVYSISYGGVKVNDVANLGTTTAKLPLPAPTVPSMYTSGGVRADCAVAE